MVRVLALDTTCNSGSVAYCCDGEVIANIDLGEGMKHGRLLLPAVRDILAANNTALAELDALAVSVGPGSYTGTRVGVMAAKSLAYGAGIKAIGISSMKALAYSARSLAEVIIPAQNARRDELYTAVYKICAGAGMEIIREDVALAPEEVAGIARNTANCAVVGDGWGKYPGIFQSLTENGVVLSDKYNTPTAASVGILACNDISSAVNPMQLEAVYMRRDDAPCTFERFMS